MDAVTAAHWRLRRTGPCEWIVADIRYPLDDSRHVIAIVVDDDVDVFVTWRTVVPLPNRYLTAEEVLDDVIRWYDQPHGGTRPIEIPSFPPVSR